MKNRQVIIYLRILCNTMHNVNTKSLFTTGGIYICIYISFTIITITVECKLNATCEDRNIYSSSSSYSVSQMLE